MSWLDRFQQASFRGVPFFVDTSSRTFGRRVALHEYPARDLPYGEDLGRKTRTFSVSGYVIGDNYDQNREYLIAACEKAGAGFYVDPYRGKVSVLCLGISVSDKKDEGNKCDFTLDFVEVGEKVYPASTANPLKNVNDKAGGLIRAASKKFSTGYTLDGLPEFVTKSTAAVMQTFGGAFDFVVNKSGEFNRALNNIDDAAGTIVQAYDKVLTAIEAPFSMLAIAGSLKERNNIYRLLARFSEGLPSINELTGTRSAEARAHREIGQLVDSHALAEGTKFAASSIYASNTDAVKTAQYWSAEIDAQMDTADADTYAALVDLRAALVAAVPSAGERLPDLKTITLQQVEPSLVTAYRLYGNANRADEIAQRNHIRHPGFMPANTSLEVLSE